MKRNSLILLLVIMLFSACSPQTISKNKERKEVASNEIYQYAYSETHPLVESARKQIGIVTAYDTNYYRGGYPPKERGACTDVIEQALRENNYNLKTKIDNDMENHPERYSHAPDPNINFRRVTNVKIFLDYYAKKLPTCTDKQCFEHGYWKPGDIVTFDQIPGSLWHIAIVSNKIKKTPDDPLGIPLLINNYGHGVTEDDMLLQWLRLLPDTIECLISYELHFSCPSSGLSCTPRRSSVAGDEDSPPPDKIHQKLALCPWRRRDTPPLFFP